MQVERFTLDATFPLSLSLVIETSEDLADLYARLNIAPVDAARLGAPCLDGGIVSDVGFNESDELLEILQGFAIEYNQELH